MFPRQSTRFLLALLPALIFSLIFSESHAFVSGQLPSPATLLPHATQVYVPYIEFGAATEPANYSAKAISTGGNHTCALTTQGEVRCWGNNGNGQLGNGFAGDQAHEPLSVGVLGLGNGNQIIAAGSGHTCAVTEEGGAMCWGYNYSGQLGDGTIGEDAHKITPVQVVGLASDVIDIATGAASSCALTGEGSVKCWGYNQDGQLGDGTITTREDDNPGAGKSVPVDVVGLESGVQAIDATMLHICALTIDGKVYCWGENLHSQLGNGDSGREANSAIPVEVIGLDSQIRDISTGHYHSCAVTVEGTVKCWGSNAVGQLGNGTADPPGGFSTVPVDVLGLENYIVAITAGRYHTCVLSSAGTVQCWGGNARGQLGDGTTASRYRAVHVVNLPDDVSAIRTDWETTCARTESGKLYCWGNNSFGQLGDGTMEDRLTPVEVAGFAGSQ